jgi:phosphatidate cytidylyltransferase
LAKSPREGKGRALPAIGTRLLGAALILPLVIWVILHGDWPFFLIVTLWVLRLVWEYDRMGQAGSHGMTLRNSLLVMLILSAFWVGGSSFGLGAFTLVAGAWLGASALRGRIEGASARVGSRLLMLFYLALLPAHWIMLRELPGQTGLPYSAGGQWLLFAAGLTWLSDTFAYLVGSLLGRHSLGSAVSPKKSIEGAVGGLLGTMLSAWLLAPFWVPFLSPWQILVAGALISIASQVGDLFESLLKRDVAIKDSGNIIPGHGGFLDRVDSLLFSLPAFYYFLVWVIF